MLILPAALGIDGLMGVHTVEFWSFSMSITFRVGLARGLRHLYFAFGRVFGLDG